MTDFITSLNDSYWGVVVWILLAAGVYFGVRTVVVQLRLLPHMFRAVTEPPYEEAELLAAGRAEAGPQKSISPFKAFTISAASRVGTGNVAGVAVAITLGGPGAVLSLIHI